VRDTSALPGDKILDPVCGMIVNVADAREHGLTIEMDEREYAFCGPGCMKTFAKGPHQYRPKVDAWMSAQKR
jgi:YHS domain-containing protein